MEFSWLGLGFMLLPWLCPGTRNNNSEKGHVMVIRTMMKRSGDEAGTAES